jgi:hypothetical protein
MILSSSDGMVSTSEARFERYSKKKRESIHAGNKSICFFVVPIILQW